MSILVRICLAVFMLCMAAISTLAAGSEDGDFSAMNDEQLIEQVWQSGGQMAEAFASNFLQSVPPAQLKAIMRPMLEELGKAETVVKTGDGEYELRTATHRVPVFLSRDGNGLISGLLLRPAIALNVDPAATLQTLMDMAPQVSVLASTDGRTIAEVNPQLRLAVGSAFKLYVLAELQARVAEGDLNWRDVVELEARHKSLPSGMMQDWPVGTPLTLQTAAQMMIAISDNTATDLLIDVVGRGAMERRSGNVPFITTRELFHIRGDRDLANRYLQADTIEIRRGLLAGLKDRPDPTLGDIRPFSLDHPAEWYFSAQELCAAMALVADLPLMTAEPGPLSRKDWKRIAFKGGSEGGVLNMTAQFEGADGRQHCLAVTLNSNRPIDAPKFSRAFVELAASLGAS
ncbi:MAG: serine hydrolase [Pseudomonadota bacterium]